MESWTRSLMVLGFTFLACLGPGAGLSGAQQPQARIEYVFPQRLVRGQSSVLSVAIQSRDAVQSVEISPAPGVAVSGIKQAKPPEASQGVAWWELTVDVAKDAAPGNRSLLLVMPMGRTAPFTVTIPSHVPGISDLRIVSAQANQPTLQLQFAAVDESADLGDSPYVWFTAGCGGTAEPLVGVVRGTVSAGVVRAAIPSPRTPGDRSSATRCDLRVRATDSSGIESDTLKTTVDFTN